MDVHYADYSAVTIFAGATNAAEKTEPGDPLTIHYQTDRPAKLAILAVDQGRVDTCSVSLQAAP